MTQGLAMFLLPFIYNFGFPRVNEDFFFFFFFHLLSHQETSFYPQTFQCKHASYSVQSHLSHLAVLFVPGTILE